MNSLRDQAGFSLIEVLITIFVVGVGLLSIAGLQVYSKQSNFDAVQRTTAAALAQDIIERMRANPTMTTAYVTNATTGISEINPVSLSADCGNGSTVCTPAQTVQYDLYKWSQALFGAAEVASDGTNAGGLASATGCITAFTSGSACGLYVTIAWRGVNPLSGTDTRTGNQYLCGSTNPNYTGSSGLPLRRLIVVQTFIDQGTPC
jgi:type IV pilus assembly protein PilV